MPDLEEVTKNLGNQNDLTNWDEIGEQRGQRVPPLPPGSYDFEVPANQGEMWTKEFEVGGDNGRPVRKRANMMLDVIVTNARDKSYIGLQKRYSIQGTERNRARRGDPERHVSDLQFFYRDALEGKEKPQNFKDLCKAADKAVRGSSFGADVEWEAYCNKKETRWIYDEASQATIEDPSGAKGCGANFYQSDLAKHLKDATGAWIGDRIQCGCGASLIVRDRLVRYRKPLAKLGQ